MTLEEPPVRLTPETLRRWIGDLEQAAPELNADQRRVLDEMGRALLPPPDPLHSGVGQWCAPGPAAEQQRRFYLRFEDQDKGEAVFVDEEQARETFARAEARSWNCQLLAPVPRTTPVDAAQDPGAVVYDQDDLECFEANARAMGLDLEPAGLVRRGEGWRYWQADTEAAWRAWLRATVQVRQFALGKQVQARTEDLSRRELPLAHLDEERLARDLERHPDDASTVAAAATRLRWLSHRLDDLVTDASHAVSWQLRYRVPERAGTGPMVWGDWLTIGKADVDGWLRRVFEQPGQFQLRPLFTQAAVPESRVRPRCDGVQGAPRDDMDGWNPWRAKFEWYWAGMECAPGTTVPQRYDMKNAALDAWRVRGEEEQAQHA